MSAKQLLPVGSKVRISHWYAEHFCRPESVEHVYEIVEQSVPFCCGGTYRVKMIKGVAGKTDWAVGTTSLLAHAHAEEARS